MAIIGTGGQAEFQALAFHFINGIENIRYYDIDPAVMEKFARNLSSFDLNLIPCDSVDSVVDGADCITTVTAAKKKQVILNVGHIAPGMMINAVGGDCPGKTELDPAILDSCKVVVEYIPQSIIEGEIQNRDESIVYAELWELVQNRKSGRHDDEEINLFDSVGFAVEDYSILRLLYDLANELGIGQEMRIIPELSDPKDIFCNFLTP